MISGFAWQNANLYSFDRGVRCRMMEIPTGFNLVRSVNGISRLFGVIASLIPIKLPLTMSARRDVCDFIQFCAAIIFPRRYRRRT